MALAIHVGVNNGLLYQEFGDQRQGFMRTGRLATLENWKKCAIATAQNRG
jgi:hypothetical protein